MIFKKLILFTIFFVILVGVIFVDKCSTNSSLPGQYKKGLSLFKDGQYTEAIGEFKRTIETNPNFEDAYEKIILAYKLERKLDEGLQYFVELCRTFPQISYPYYALGIILSQKKEYQNATENYSKAVQLQPQFPNAYAALAKSYKKLNKLNEVIEFFEVQLHQRPGNPYPYFGLATAYSLQFDGDSSLKYIEKSLQLKKDNPLVYLLEMQVLGDQGKYNQSIEIGNQSLQFTEKWKDLKYRCAILCQIGRGYYSIGDYDKAEDQLHKALKISKQIAEREIEASTLNLFGIVSRHRGEFTQAFSYLSQANQICREIMDDEQTGIILKNTGDVYLESGQYEEALSNYEEALNIFIESGDVIDRADVYGAMANVFGYTGKYEKEVEFRKRAIQIYREVDYKSGLCHELCNLGASFIEQTKYQEAIEFLNQGLSLAIEINDQYLRQKSLANIGIVYYFMGDFEKATQHLEDSYKLAYKSGDMNSAAACLMNIGSIYYELGDTIRALQNFEKAHPVFREGGDPKGEAIVVANISTIYTEQKNYEQALEYVLKALEINKRINNPYGEGDTYNNLGTLYFKLVQYDNAIDAHKEALVIGKRLQVIRIIWESAYNVGKVYEQKGDFASAVDYYKLAIDKIESVREQILVPEQKSTFLANKFELYQRIIDLLFKLHGQNHSRNYDQEAFRYAERAKARTLLDILAESNLLIKEGVDSTLLKREQEILQTISAMQTKQYSQTLSAEQLGGLRDSLLIEEESLGDLRVELKKKNPAYSELKYPEPTTIDQVQKQVLSKNNLLLEYFLGDEHSYLWAVSQDGAYVYVLPPQREIVGLVSQYLSVISKPPQIGTSPHVLGLSLYDLLLAPAKDMIQSATDLIIVPDGILHYLPFEALIINDGSDNHQYLAESFQISYAPSASVLEFIGNRSEKETRQNTFDLLAFGDPVFNQSPQLESVAKMNTPDVTDNNMREPYAFSALPYSINEIESLKKLFDPTRTRIYLKNEASEENLKSELLNQYRIIHFATHALIDEENPGFSGIMLILDNDPTEDGFLQMNEIFNLQLDVDLVTLSACQTGGGRLVRGEGIVGLTRAFFYAGARSLLVSLWSVNDQSTAKLMEKFYYYLQKGKSQTEALGLAKTDLITGDNRALHHPYFWAPFVLIGENQ